MTTVSAIVPFFGDPGAVLPLIEALFAQTHPLQEIIVADDCSPTPFPEISGVTVIRRSRNGGFGSAVNAGASRTTGDLLLILNSDLTITRDFVESLLVAACPWQPAVVSPGVIEHGALAPTGKRWPSTTRVFFAWLTFLARIRDTSLWRRLVGHLHTPDLAVTGAAVDWVLGACMLIPAAQFKSVGGFDERFYMNSEEVDLQRRLRDIGIGSVLIPAVTVEHEGGGSSDPDRRRQWLVDGTFIYAEKHDHPSSLRAALNAATTLNLLWNLIREWLGADVRARATFQRERVLIRHGFRLRHGRDLSGD